MVGVSADVRASAGVAAGDDVEIEMELDRKPREVSVPPELSQALGQDPAARTTFDALSYSNKRRLVDPIATAKTAKTRDRNLARALSQLRDEGR